MAEVFCAWELGGGLGHLTRLRPLIAHLIAHGHRVSVAARHLANVRAVLGDGITLYQAPLCLKRVSAAELRTLSFSQILYNVGYHDADGLAAQVTAWSNLMAVRRPSLVIADHAPTALLTAHTLGCPAIAFANGFQHPPAATPLAPLMPLKPAQRAELIRLDDAIGATIDRALALVGGRPLGGLPGLYASAAEAYLCTTPEFDHFGPRQAANYIGPGADIDDGLAPEWPPGIGPRVFAYLSFNPGLKELLERLAQEKLAILAYCPDAPPALRAHLGEAGIRFAPRPLALEAVAAEAAVGLVNANHGTSFRLLRRGLPLVLAPSQAEQRTLALRLVETGAVAVGSLRQPLPTAQLVTRLATEDRFRLAAASLAEKLDARDYAALHRAAYTRIETSLG